MKKKLLLSTFVILMVSNVYAVPGCWDSETYNECYQFANQYKDLFMPKTPEAFCSACEEAGHADLSECLGSADLVAGDPNHGPGVAYLLALIGSSFTPIPANEIPAGVEVSLLLIHSDHVEALEVGGTCTADWAARLNLSE